MNARNVMNYGAAGDGLQDDRAPIQAALDEGPGEIYFPEGTYRITNEVMINSGRILELGAAVITTDATPIPRLFRTQPGSYGIRILNGTLGEGQHGAGVDLCVDGVDDLFIDGTRFSGARQDGIWVGGPDATPSRNIAIRQIRCDGNLRNGLSIVFGDDVLIDDSMFDENGGADPSSGADLEPNPAEDVAGVTFHRCTFARNVKNGLYIQKGKGNPGRNVNILDCIFSDNASYGLIGNAVSGFSVERCMFERSNCGASIGDGTAALIFSENTITDCNRSLILAGVEDPRVFANLLCKPLEFIAAGGLQAISGEIYFNGNEVE